LFFLEEGELGFCKGWDGEFGCFGGHFQKAGSGLLDFAINSLALFSSSSFFYYLKKYERLLCEKTLRDGMKLKGMRLCSNVVLREQWKWI
jgi:hypothetical protein